MAAGERIQPNACDICKVARYGTRRRICRVCNRHVCAGCTASLNTGAICVACLPPASA